ncbi:DUF202 domain-containing protein [Hymenobacter profundi]|uniref:DUF202 domain-containing protein n=1 Tax=Hymenobacter profundi TaxID=1982110 RepID=A0ABS6WWK3_9BACT|nr:DUF202 domain-containing protein [Hymenobacter profundi]MBW3127139.1 DUF202 domain-containing protein [Hymenobacter profundi]
MPSPAPLPANYDQQRLAAARTRMANERTFLTYLRTSLALVGFGLALIQLHPLRGAGIGYGALGVAGIMLLVGWLRFRMRRREMEECRLPAPVTP